MPTPIERPEALASWFQALQRLDGGEPGLIVRALHWGDSTIAGDGITSTVRDRLQARFGDGGPGFLAVAVDPRWAVRPGILRVTSGEWESLGITFGGAETPGYGLAGTLATARGEAAATLGGRQLPGTQGSAHRQPLHRFDLHYQTRPGGGSLSLKPRGASGFVLSTASISGRTGDAFRAVESPEGASTVYLKTMGDGPVTVYGLALETRGPGLTWESFGVVGAGLGSVLNHQPARHLRAQVERRQPALIVYQTGGNELSYPSLTRGDGSLYQKAYLDVLGRLRAGAPDAACLVITPLDQATRERGQIVSKPTLGKLIEVQRRAAREAGCAFWDARAAMGGEGAIARWLQHEPRLAWADLRHLSDEGAELIGHSLADALLAAYEEARTPR